MAESVSLQTLLTYLTFISVPVGVFYHIMTLRNTKKNQELQLETRQAQLFMNLFESFRSLEFRRLWHQVMVYDWKDGSDWEERFNERTNPEAIASFTSVMSFFTGIGLLLKEGLVDIRLVHELMAPTIMVTWARYEPIFMWDREFFQNPEMWGNFEYLYNTIKEIYEDPKGLEQAIEFFRESVKKNIVSTPTSI